MTILRRLERRGADPTLPWGSSFIPTNSMLGLIAAGVPVNDDTALSIAVVNACIRILCNAVSTLPLNAYKRTNDKTRKVVDSELLADPWPEGTLQDWLTQVVASMALRGNFYGTIEHRDDRGYATMIRPWHPDDVVARRDASGQRVYRFKGVPRATSDVLHIPHLLVPGAFIGLNPIEYMRQSWGLAAAAEKYGGQFFANSANPSGVLEVEGSLSPEKTRALARSWRTAHQGLGNALTPAVLTDGVTFKQLSIAPNDAQFLQTRQFQKTEIASVFFGVPPTMVGDSDPATRGQSPEDLEMQFVTNTLMGWLTRIENPLTKLLPRNQYCKFDVSVRLRGDTLARFTAYQYAINGGWMNNDEIRDREDQPAMPNGLGQVFWRPINFAPAQKIIDAPLPGSGTGASGGPGGGAATEGNPATPGPGSKPPVMPPGSK
jgi:HK97 family phage portal protein